MSYTALYRKYRPATFNDVKGQDHIITTLKNQIKADRIGHAYLFCGTRGTGKTTIAKIVAKAVNCENPVDGSPCGECATCKAIQKGSNLNVIEIDAASNNGVENIRQIIEDVSYTPTSGRFKVYIIDEVHMLSIGAFNALLKTLEEPPAHVIFILATTEPHKLPITILSRCQRYDFKRITVDEITKRLKGLMELEKISVEEKGLRYVSKMADGSMRDALSLLDQCIAFNFGEKLTCDKIMNVLGAVDNRVFTRLFTYIVNKDIIASIDLLEEIIVQGKELIQFVADFTWYLRNLMLVKSNGTEDSNQLVELLDQSKESIDELIETAKNIDMNAIMRYIHIFSDLSNRIKFSSQKRILIETTLIKMSTPAMETDINSILSRIHDLEEQLKNGITVPASTVQVNNVKAVINEKAPLPKAIPEDVQEVVSKWSMIVSNTAQPMKTYIKHAQLSLGGDNKLMIIVQDGVSADYLAKNEEHKARLEETIGNIIGKEISVTIQVTNENDNKDKYIDLSKIINIDIDISDEEETMLV